MNNAKMCSYERLGKRVIDVIGAFIGLVALAPLMALIAFLVRTKLGSPVLFRQLRPGKDGRPFYMYKFRTMTSACDDAGQLLPDSDRLTRFGEFLRSTSLDELPELWNVLWGDMSLVGPRPLLIEYLDRYTASQARRHAVKPGITGWAQVNGRNGVSWKEKFLYDLWYVEHLSLGFDLWILVRTIFAVLSRKGISAHGHATMPEYQSSPRPNQDRERTAA